MDAQLEDLDTELIETYKTKIGAEDVATEQMLRARGFTKLVDPILRIINTGCTALWGVQRVLPKELRGVFRFLLLISLKSFAFEACFVHLYVINPVSMERITLYGIDNIRRIGDFIRVIGIELLYWPAAFKAY